MCDKSVSDSAYLFAFDTESATSSRHPDIHSQTWISPIVCSTGMRSARRMSSWRFWNSKESQTHDAVQTSDFGIDLSDSPGEGYVFLV